MVERGYYRAPLPVTALITYKTHTLCTQCWNRTNCSTVEGWRATSALIAKSKFAECVFNYGCGPADSNWEHQVYETRLSTSPARNIWWLPLGS